jgi:putative hydrolase of the HAD superfamily
MTRARPTSPRSEIRGVEHRAKRLESAFGARAVLFDFYGTVAYAESWGPTREEVLARHGYELPATVRQRWTVETIDGLEHREHSRSRDHYLAWERTRIRTFLEECGVGPDDAERVAQDIHETSRTFAMAAYPEAHDVLVALRESGVTLALCSNWSWDLDRAVEQAGLTGLFDVEVTSAQAGTRKPHPHIFEHTLDRCGVAAADAVFVGDSFGPDVEGPLGVGMGAAIHVYRDGEEPPRPAPPLPVGAARVADLRGVLDLV